LNAQFHRHRIALRTREAKHAFAKVSAGARPLPLRRPNVPPVDDQDGCLQQVVPQKVPVDGELVEGKGTADESMVTGEPIPVSRRPAPR
jgi:hypothetical protein